MDDRDYYGNKRLELAGQVSRHAPVLHVLSSTAFFDAMFNILVSRFSFPFIKRKP